MLKHLTIDAPEPEIGVDYLLLIQLAIETKILEIFYVIVFCLACMLNGIGADRHAMDDSAQSSTQV
ncbi:uncharacterized protein RSE6_11995 [Rhynchosporium secalis]|uniref:Uncharacterized protein n=1 Tax=Rhynchosporium secalis TaxID=38038 RepID=A0A1E1MPE8_RHYSE|nr:uncharacterized protein RSE6_11995 [Rhynchosporium secalis]